LLPGTPFSFKIASQNTVFLYNRFLEHRFPLKLLPGEPFPLKNLLPGTPFFLKSVFSSEQRALDGKAEILTAFICSHEQRTFDAEY
jgi:hypothetical protein